MTNLHSIGRYHGPTCTYLFRSMLVSATWTNVLYDLQMRLHKTPDNEMASEEGQTNWPIYS